MTLICCELQTTIMPCPPSNYNIIVVMQSLKIFPNGNIQQYFNKQDTSVRRSKNTTLKGKLFSRGYSKRRALVRLIFKFCTEHSINTNQSIYFNKFGRTILGYQCNYNELWLYIPKKLRLS